MRKELLPDFEFAEKHYLEVKDLIERYTEYIDENGDEDEREYQRVVQKLCDITGKNDLSEYNIWEYWEEEGIEIISFRICLPKPKLVEMITKDELTAILQKINEANDYLINDCDCDEIEFLKNSVTRHYYHDLLRINFPKTYNGHYFNRQKDKDGNWFEYSTEEIVEKIWK